MPPAACGPAGCVASRCCRRTPSRVGQCGDDLHQHLGAVLVEFGHRDAVGRRIGGANPTLGLQCHQAVGHQPRPSAVREHPCPPAAQFVGKFGPELAEGFRRQVQQTFAARVAGDADALERQHTLHHRPAVVDGSEHIGIGHPQIVEEHLVEVVGAHHRLDGAHRDRRIRHGHQEYRQAVLFLTGRLVSDLRSTHQQKTPLRHRRVGGPDLLTVDHPAVPVTHRGGPQRCQVRAGLRLGKPLAPDDFTGRDRRQVPGLLLGGAVAHDDRPDPVDAHVLRAAWFVVRPHLLAHHGLLPRG
ncbi:MAG: hypothetical protein K0R33_2583 [Mycobacterium sp.]|nr:hypothetical protein [Mycobacterium sp.]